MSWFGVTLARLRSLAGRNKLERELDDELRFHLDMQIDDNVRAGMSPSDARYAALRSFGAVEPMKETYRDRRGIGMIETTVSDIRYALRTLRKSPGFALTCIFTLALAIGVNTAMFSLVRGVLLRPLPYPNADRVVALWETNSRQGIEQELVTPGDFADWRNRAQSFDQLAFSPAWPGARTVKLLGNDVAERLAAAYVSANYFSVLGVAPAVGRSFLDDENTEGGAAVAILSHDMWHNRFAGRREILGTTIRLTSHGKQEFVVIGVMPPGFRFPEKTDVWLPAGQMGITIPPPGSGRRGGPWLEVIGLLKPGVTPDVASHEINAIAAGLSRQLPFRRSGSQVKVVRLHDQIAGSMRAGLLALLGAVSCVLLIGCVNVATLLLARFGARRRELAVRAALGAGRLRMVRQILLETLLLFVSGGIVGSVGAWWLVRLVTAAVGDRLPRFSETSLDLTVLGYTAAICFIAAMLFGLVPATQAIKANLAEGMLEGNRIRGVGLRGRRLWSSLVVAEVAMAFMLLIGAGLFARSLILLQSVDPGFRPENTLAIGLDMTGGNTMAGIRPQAQFAALLDRVRALPGVVSAGGASLLPMQGGGWQDRPGGGWSNQGFIIENRVRPLGQPPMTADPRVITPGYFETMKIPLRAGRLFAVSDSASSPLVVIVNEAMARRYWASTSPIGQRISFTDDRGEPPRWMEVVGVVGDARTAGLEAPARPELMLPFDQSVWTEAGLIVRTSADPLALANAIRREIRSLSKSISVTHVRTMENVISESVLQPRLRTLILVAFSTLGLILAAVGLFGVLSYSVTQRRSEIGIRMAIGATAGEVFRMVIGAGVRLCLIGLAVGLVGAFWLGQAGSSLLFGVTATDPFTFTAVSLILVIVALAACYIPARRAMRVEPITALRQD